jgi:hypothetical protein
MQQRSNDTARFAYMRKQTLEIRIVFSMPARATSSGKDIAIQKLPWITEHDVMAFTPYPAQDGTFGALFQLDEHGASCSIP